MMQSLDFTAAWMGKRMTPGDSGGEMAKKTAAAAAALLTFYAVYAVLRFLLLQLVEVCGVPQMEMLSVTLPPLKHLC